MPGESAAAICHRRSGDRLKHPTAMDETFDSIILGTGHNALVLQAYLSRCGLRTLASSAPLARVAACLLSRTRGCRFLS
jgi:hypothetical protein